MTSTLISVKSNAYEKFRILCFLEKDLTTVFDSYENRPFERHHVDNRTYIMPKTFTIFNHFDHCKKLNIIGK